MIEGYRRMTPGQRVARMSSLTRSVRRLALSRIRAEHPEADEHELMLRLAALRFDRETMIRAFGWDPREHGA